MLTYRTGATRLVVYRSDEAGHNRANAVVWGVGDEIDAIVAALKSAGATFDHYPEIGPFADGVHHVGGMKLVWLKDPDGNILHINSMWLRSGPAASGAFPRHALANSLGGVPAGVYTPAIAAADHWPGRD